jgi:hypothetical protein
LHGAPQAVPAGMIASMDKYGSIDKTDGLKDNIYLLSQAGGLIFTGNQFYYERPD